MGRAIRSVRLVQAGVMLQNGECGECGRSWCVRRGVRGGVCGGGGIGRGRRRGVRHRREARGWVKSLSPVGLQPAQARVPVLPEAARCGHFGVQGKKRAVQIRRRNRRLEASGTK